MGILFRSTVNTTDNEELIAFLTPRIVTGEEPYTLTRDTKKQLKPLRPLSVRGAGAAKEPSGKP